jgi:hypothetical protein
MAAFLFVRHPPAEAHVVPRLRETPMGIDVARLSRLLLSRHSAAGDGLRGWASSPPRPRLQDACRRGACEHQIARKMAALPSWGIALGSASHRPRGARGPCGRDAASQPGAMRAGMDRPSRLASACMAVAAGGVVCCCGSAIRAFTHGSRTYRDARRCSRRPRLFRCSTACRRWRPAALRGLGDTRTAMLWNLGATCGGRFARSGVRLCFHRGYGVAGLRVGTLGRAHQSACIGLVRVWMRKGHARCSAGAARPKTLDLAGVRRFGRYGTAVQAERAGISSRRTRRRVWPERHGASSSVSAAHAWSRCWPSMKTGQIRQLRRCQGRHDADTWRALDSPGPLTTQPMTARVMVSTPSCRIPTRHRSRM